MYVIAAAVVLGGVLWLFPQLRQVLSPDPGADAGARQLERAIDSTVPPVESVRDQLLGGLIALLTSLIFAAPVTAIYMVTKRQEGFQRTFVQVLIMLPVVVAAVVRVVRGDLALAFALAGIVAAVRFRTTLRDLKNAVYAFTAIGIGLASGTGAWPLAALLATVFSLTAYTLWKLDVGGVDSSLSVPDAPMRLSEALVPGESQESVAVGSNRIVGQMGPEILEKYREQARRLAHFIRADALKNKRKYRTLLLIYTTDIEIARDTAERLMGDFAQRWHLVEVFPGPAETTVMAYLLRLKKSADIGEFLELLHCAEDCPLRAAELKPIKGLRKLLT